MNQHKRQLALVMSIFYLIGVVFFAVEIADVHNYFVDYLLVYFAYIVTGLLYLYLTFWRGAFLFEPIVLVGMLFFLSYTVVPMINILVDNANCRGFEVMSGCKTATIIYIFSFIILLFFYHGSLRKKGYAIIEWNDGNIEDLRHYDLTLQILVVSYIWWGIGCFFFLVFFVRHGYSITYVLTLGINGYADETTATDGFFDFLYNFRFCMVAPIIYLSQYSKNRHIYKILYIITFLEFTAYGFRNVLVELIVAPLVFYYTKNKKVPKILDVLKLIIGIIFMIAIVEIIRGSVRMGTGAHNADWSSFSLISVWNAFEGNFDLYKTMYGIVNYIPEYHSYTYGQQLIWMTVTFLIPRAIWKGKPRSVLDSLMPNIVGSLAVRGHMAMGTLAEYYGEFGVIGCIICCAILGSSCRYIKRWYEYKERTEDTLIAYAVCYPMLMLLAIRGYMPLNYEHILFFEIPVMTVAVLKHSKRGH